MRISWTKSKKQLATLWFVGSGIAFFIMLYLTIVNRFEDNTNKVWEWFLPTFLPTLSLIISVLVMDALGKGTRIKTVDKFIFRLTLSLSSLYLVVLILTIVLSTFALNLSGLDPTAFMSQSNLWLAPFQGLVTASLGAFFIGGN